MKIAPRNLCHGFCWKLTFQLDQKKPGPAALGGDPNMSTKRYKPEQIVNLLRKIEVEITNGKTTPHAAREAAITE